MAQQLFVPTGSMETFVVPPHQPGTLRVWLRGGRGGRLQTSLGGNGGTASGLLDLPAGTTLHIVAGYGAARGTYPGYTYDPAEGDNPFQPAGFGPYFGGQGGDGVDTGEPVGIGRGSKPGGGCSSDIRLGGTTVSDRIVVAGGGGGGGHGSFPTANSHRGGAGGLNNGTGSAGAGGTRAGGGGSHSAGGSAGNNALMPGDTTHSTATAGGFGTGGAGGGIHPFGEERIYGGSGGGGGYYGGGGGGGARASTYDHGAGGGGSSYFDPSLYGGDPGVPETDLSAIPSGYGYVLFEWEEPRRHGRHLGLVRGSRGVG